MLGMSLQVLTAGQAFYCGPSTPSCTSVCQLRPALPQDMPTVLAWASGLCNPFSREAKAACDPACRVAPLAVLSGASSSVTAVSRDCKGHS